MGVGTIKLGTIEDLAMSLVEEQHGYLYRHRIEPLYKIVKDNVRKALEWSKSKVEREALDRPKSEGDKSIKIEFGYGTDYYKLGLDLIGKLYLIAELQDKFGFGGMVYEYDAEFTNTYKVVVYLLSNKNIGWYDEQAKELVEKSFKEVSAIHGPVQEGLTDCLICSKRDS